MAVINVRLEVSRIIKFNQDMIVFNLNIWRGILKFWLMLLNNLIEKLM